MNFNFKKQSSNIGGWKIILYFSIFIFVASLIFSFFYLTNLNNKFASYYQINNSKTENRICKNCARRLIDGVYVTKGQENNKIYAVVIDNQPGGRPAFGIAEANLVYEAEAEGRITRYLAFFSNDLDLKKVGPVRSVRPYFVDWAKEFNALLVHCGGSPEALAKIKNEKVLSINEFYNGDYYWRASNMPAPHNIYTSTGNLTSYINKNNLAASQIISWLYKDEDKKIATTSSPIIKIDFKDYDFAVQWNYDIINNEYVRYLNEKIDKDGNEKEIKAKNIIIQFMETEVIDEKLRLKIQTIGQGKTLVCLDGECREGLWKKISGNSRTRYYVNGEEVAFNAGPTWVEVVRENFKINY
ncbi:MAG: DUF3048 domain-containing protein [Patescibacteria group bacterium]